MTRRTYLLAQALLIPSGFWMHIAAARSFGPWIWAEMLAASGLLPASYLLARVLILCGRDSISILNDMRKDKPDLEAELNPDPLTSLYNRKPMMNIFPE